MSTEKRRDNKDGILRTGESQRKDGRYFNISFYNKKTDIPIEIICLILIYVPILHLYKVYIGLFLLLASIFNII